MQIVVEYEKNGKHTFKHQKCDGINDEFGSSASFFFLFERNSALCVCLCYM